MEVTLHQGGREGRPQGEDWQVLGASRKGGIRNGERRNWKHAHPYGKQALESEVFGNGHASFGGGPGEKGWQQYLACGLSYFALAFIGPKEEAEGIKQRLWAFLHDELKLQLSEEKTLITHARDSAASFLGYEITTRQSNAKQTLDRNGYRGRSINGDIGLKVPAKVIREKCQRYKRHGKAFHRAELLNESDYTIVATYQLEYRGIVNYYRLADNLRVLTELKWVMEQSLTKTLAAKHKISVRKVYQKYQADLEVDGKTYKGLQVNVPREGKKPLRATWGGIPLIWDINAFIDDQPKRYQWNKSELEKRLLAQECEQCGATRATDRIEVHHIRALKDLEKYTGREKPQ